MDAFPIAVSRGRHWNEATARRICDWVEANGVSPRTTAAIVVWTPDLVDLVEFMLHPDSGKRYKDPIQLDRPAHTTRRFEVVVPMPEDLIDAINEYASIDSEVVA